MILLRPIQWAAVKHRTEQLTDAQEAKHKQISVDLNSRGACTGSGAPRREVAVTGRCCWSSPLEAVGKHSAAPPLSAESPSPILALGTLLWPAQKHRLHLVFLPFYFSQLSCTFCPSCSSLLFTHSQTTFLALSYFEGNRKVFFFPSCFGIHSFFWPQLVLIQSAVDDGKISFPIMMRFLLSEATLFKK